MFFRLKPSDDAAKIATSVTPAACARSRPARFGTSAVYRVPGRRSMEPNSSPVSAICGTHLGLTNAPTSTTGKPAADNRLMNVTLSGVEILVASF
jgi:hypothetical protein